MYAKSLSLGGNTREALSVYRQVFEEGGGTEVADDALFEYAALLSDEGRISDAVDTYMRLYREYPRSALAEESLYRRGELLMRDERYEEAREAYYEHRSRFPGGDLVDVSLYWGAVAARRSGEPYGAALLLERLVEEFPESALHADALKDLAELYEEVREYERAVRYYTRYRSLYPEEAGSFEIGRRVETLKEIMDGKSPREAELSVIVEQEGLDSRRGREAAVELAGIYLGSFTSESDELRDRALSLLRSVVERKDEDAQSAARAQYLLGEYHRREGDHADAARAYAQAAVTARGDEDLSARSMYMAAESALEAGDRAGAARMVSTLESEFPDSEWAAEGRRLIDENS
jgi:TolA-binding protein